MALIQSITKASKKYGHIIVLLIGLYLLTSALLLVLKEAGSIQYYDMRRYNSVIKIPAPALAVTGVVFLIWGIKKEWIWKIKRIFRKNEQ
ncbi:hypothetical protein [uncultured Chitinophaga sp.]|uniref:hypothetical protein n=1 Tax=uncultured Chitinophaga sp. TaxID=339340 RepID=UPI0025F2474D|nr:hypothetical protein [uncultured Chitinophaga sp.]